MVDKVYLGYEDEPILNEHRSEVSYATNKIGGEPNWPAVDGLAYVSTCGVCGSLRPLVLQCYAPLQLSPYHRTLYVFACVNPTCWNHGPSWSCIRAQSLDKSYKTQSVACAHDPVVNLSTDSWCNGADEWGDEPETNCDRSPAHQTSIGNADMTSIEISIENLGISDAINEITTSAPERVSAQLEAAEGMEIIVEAPFIPQSDINALLKQLPEAPKELSNPACCLKFEEKFMTVEEEYLTMKDSQHVQELLAKYQKTDIKAKKVIQQKKSNNAFDEGNLRDEDYEESVPLHGNDVFHNFLTRIQYNPTQILRYSLNGLPLVMSPLPADGIPKNCSSCNATLRFEMQLLPTLIPSLRLHNYESASIDFGTVLVFTCKESCWKEGDVYKEEIIVLQQEPDT